MAFIWYQLDVDRPQAYFVNTMRIAWATPFNIGSAIARYSREVCCELINRGIDVEILRIEDPESEEIEVLPTSIIVHAASNAYTDEFLRSFDAVVVNIGDYVRFHFGAINLMARLPTICIVHDADLRHFVDGAVSKGVSLNQIAATFKRSSAVSEERDSELALFASLSSVCVAHGPHYVDILKKTCPGSVGLIPLCYPDLGSLEPAERLDDRFVVTVFGMINSNKQPERVMEAIALSPKLKSRAILRLIGPIEDSQRVFLEALAAELGLNTIEIHGRVSDARLCELLAGSHAICCLRYPISEGGSASLITALYSARPLVVPRFASYDDVPDELVWKVSYGTEVADLSETLQMIEQDPLSAEMRAKPMKEWALARYSASAYVDSLYPLIEAGIGITPLLEAGRLMGGMLEEMTVAFDDVALERVSNKMKCLFDPLQFDQGKSI
jgi:glycosyltransferase involved in cell wall biosynthesis